MGRFLLAWELGANLGHVTRLRPVAQALRSRGHEVGFALRDVVGAHGLIGPGPVFQAPLWLGSVSRPAWSMADVLLSCGYDSAATLGGLVAAWRHLFEALRCEALVADHSPTALLAARTAGLPAVHVGQGFTIPPQQSPLPVFRDWSAVDPAQAAQSDAKALATANSVLAEHGAPPLTQLADLFYPERTLLCTWPELDHYAGRGRRDVDYLGPDGEWAPGAAPVWPEVTGPRVFCYLRASHPEHAAVLRALVQAGCATVCFLPDGAPPVAHPAVHYSAQPLDLQQVLPCCDLVVCHAGQATVAQALSMGVPCLLLPTQAEQFLLAREVERHGAAVNTAVRPPPVDYAALVREMTQPESPHARAAKAVAQKYRGYRFEAITAQVADAAEALLAVPAVASRR